MLDCLRSVAAVATIIQKAPIVLAHDCVVHVTPFCASYVACSCYTTSAAGWWGSNFVQSHIIFERSPPLTPATFLSIPNWRTVMTVKRLSTMVYHPDLISCRHHSNILFCTLLAPVAKPLMVIIFQAMLLSMILMFWSQLSLMAPLLKLQSCMLLSGPVLLPRTSAAVYTDSMCSSWLCTDLATERIFNIMGETD